MGIRSMPWSEWIEIDKEYAAYHRARKFRLQTRGREVVRVLDDRTEGVQIRGGAEAAKELVYEIAEYLSRRYPSTFSVTRYAQSEKATTSPPSVGGLPLAWDGLSPIKTITIVPLGETYDLSVLESMSGTDMGEEAMRICAMLVQEDLAIMIEGDDGQYYFQAGAILIPGFWRMRDKIGMPLDEIHVSGNVPQFREKLKTSMERFFRRMPVDKPVIRNNYFVQVVRPQAQEKHEEDHDHDREHDPVAEEAETASDADPEELGWSASTNGDEDGFAHGHGHSAEAASYLAPATLRIRSERQTLRRLPRSGAVVFGIRTYLFKVEELARERGVPARLASAVRSWPDDVAVYKGRKMYKDVLLRYLDECAERDVAEGGNGVEDGKGYPF
ncbi:hypothetical protein CONPUDRAFT_92213 [Coniophora puteana RWD-64-598 SS2]|uniref:Uncharacterized protein n=1 Tax=Coniophora puteana (strain RWD-64-598) TaxID=741705 RepID=A0A5M3MGJ6_CONPW|nr:uncharacterized protein CONPUDRAFT_92213 [Coniophora puteana RWD-64-598 SS2]EIW77884.1 hypothetical protein CONPUDRAFT_92213 [Coniophora puteana RWD-64-598 SS2]